MRRVLAVLLSLLWLSAAVWADVTVDGTPATVFGADITQLTVSNYTVGCSSNPLIFAGVSSNNTGCSVTSATFDAVGLSSVTDLALSTVHAHLWSLVGPTIGTANLVVNFNTAGCAAAVAAISFCGVNQSNPLGTPVTTSVDPGAAMSVAVTVPSGGMALGVCVIAGPTSGAYTLDPVAGATEQWDVASGPTTGASAEGHTRTATGDFGLQNWGVNEQATLVGVPINPAPTAGGFQTRRRF